MERIFVEKFQPFEKVWSAHRVVMWLEGDSTPHTLTAVQYISRDWEFAVDLIDNSITVNLLDRIQEWPSGGVAMYAAFSRNDKNSAYSAYALYNELKDPTLHVETRPGVFNDQYSYKLTSPWYSLRCRNILLDCPKPKEHALKAPLTPLAFEQGVSELKKAYFQLAIGKDYTP